MRPLSIKTRSVNGRERLANVSRTQKCVGNVYAQIPAHGGPPVWQYISLPRGPVGPDQPRGVHLENRILRGWTHQMCRIRADIEPFEMV